MIPSRLVIVAPMFRIAPYFSTANTDRRRTFLTDADVRSVLREAIGTLRLIYPFLIGALLPAPANESARTRAPTVLSPLVHSAEHPCGHPPYAG